jgi:hypothetical protein
MQDFGLDRFHCTNKMNKLTTIKEGTQHMTIRNPVPGLEQAQKMW